MGQHRFSPMCDFMDKCPQIFSASWRWQGRQSMRFLKKTVPLCGRSAAPQWPAYVSTRRTVTFARETAPPADHVDRYARRHAHGSSLRPPRANGHGSGSRSHVGDERQSREICCPQTPRNYRKLACGEHRRQAPGAESCAKEGSLWRRNATDDLQRTNGLDARKDHFAATRYLSGQGGDVDLMSDQ